MHGKSVAVVTVFSRSIAATRAPFSAHEGRSLTHLYKPSIMAALQVNALFKKAAPAPAKKAAPAKKGLFGAKPAPAKKTAPAKKAAPVKKAAPAKTKVVKKAAPVKKKSSGKPSQAGGDLAKWYGEYRAASNAQTRPDRFLTRRRPRRESFPLDITIDR
jgi:hypothetical protein